MGEADALSDPEALLGGELEEEVNVAYVAATRATECLYVGPGLDEWPCTSTPTRTLYP